MLVQFNDTSEFRKITMQESGDIVQPREKFPCLLWLNVLLMS